MCIFFALETLECGEMAPNKRQKMVDALMAAGVRFARNASVNTLQPLYDELIRNAAANANIRITGRQTIEPPQNAAIETDANVVPPQIENEPDANDAENRIEVNADEIVAAVQPMEVRVNVNANEDFVRIEDENSVSSVQSADNECGAFDEMELETINAEMMLYRRRHELAMQKRKAMLAERENLRTTQFDAKFSATFAR